MNLNWVDHIQKRLVGRRGRGPHGGLKSIYISIKKSFPLITSPARMILQKASALLVIKSNF